MLSFKMLKENKSPPCEGYVLFGNPRCLVGDVGDFLFYRVFRVRLQAGLFCFFVYTLKKVVLPVKFRVSFKVLTKRLGREIPKAGTPPCVHFRD
jgi:hypothetical protein